MKIGLTYTARSMVDRLAPADATSNGCGDDAEEEFDSPETIAAIAAALDALGHQVELLGDGPALAERLLAGPSPEFVFNIAEGRGAGRCREAWAPSLLEMFGIPYSGSDPLTLAATLDKDCAKRLVHEAGGNVPAGVLVDNSPHGFTKQLDALQLPVIVKPAFEGSSKGIRSTSLIDQRHKLFDVVCECRETYRQSVLVEEFIDGDELTVGILGNHQPEVLGIMRVVPLHANGPFVYSLDVKRDWRNQVRYEIPAKLSPADDSAVRQAALLAFRALGCHDVARIDFRLRDGVPYFLEANPLPGLSPGSSDLVLLAEAIGMGYQELIGRILNAALERGAHDAANRRSELESESCGHSSAFRLPPSAL